MLLLDDSSPTAHVVDPSHPPSAKTLHDALVTTWPRLADRVHHTGASLDAFAFDRHDVVVSSHACGSLTDRVLDRAVAARARLAVLPCCHDAVNCDAGTLAGWVDLPLAIDLRRAARLESEGYRIWTQTVPLSITPKNRLLLGEYRGSGDREDGSWRRRRLTSAFSRQPSTATSTSVGAKARARSAGASAIRKPRRPPLMKMRSMPVMERSR